LMDELFTPIASQLQQRDQPTGTIGLFNAICGG
jgi:hypothetical protein